MFSLIKEYLESRLRLVKQQADLVEAKTSLAEIQHREIDAALDDREHEIEEHNAAIEAAQKKRDKKRKAKKKAKRDARELTETIASFAPLLGVAGAVVGHILGKQEGAAIGERIGRHAQASLEDATKDDFFGNARSERAQNFLSKILVH